MKSILSSPLTFVMAGSGFGKTTAVSCFLEELPEEICRWYTCFGEPPERAWSGICTLLSFADPHTAEFLSKINAPTLDSLGHIFSLMDGLSCSEETILVIDNYQLSGFASPYRLLDALAAHHCKNLHIVVLSQPIQTEKMITVSNPHIVRIPQNMFSFQPDDIQKLFSKNCAKISIEEAERLYSMTEGWAAALQLHLSQYLDSGLLKEHVGISELIERAFWGALIDEYREFFLGLSLLNTFTEAQASRILGEKTVPDALWSLVLRNPFVHRDEAEYTLHGLLKEFLSAKCWHRPMISAK